MARKVLYELDDALDIPLEDWDAVYTVVRDRCFSALHKTSGMVRRKALDEAIKVVTSTASEPWQTHADRIRALQQSGDEVGNG